MTHLWNSLIAVVCLIVLGAILSVGMACFVGGCASTSKIVRTVQLGKQAVQATEPILVAAYEAAQEACVADEDSAAARECVLAVRAQFEPVINAIHQFHVAFCDIEVDASECQ